jgi:hypothetical protein
MIEKPCKKTGKIPKIFGVQRVKHSVLQKPKNMGLTLSGSLANIGYYWLPLGNIGLTISYYWNSTGYHWVLLLQF